MLLSRPEVLPLRRPLPLVPSYLALLLGLAPCFSSLPCSAGENQAIGLSASILPANTSLQNTVWGQIAARHQLDPYVLYAVALVESRKQDPKHQVTPWPWALNHAGKAIMPDNKQDAVILLKQLLDEGYRNVDIGLMQVNLRWQGHRVDKPEHLLDPLTNLEVGAMLLAEAIQSAPDNLALGVGRYYNWKNVSAAIKYGQKVIAIAEQIRTVI
ncbi:transglycosylase SLT domain-containing protein [Methylicorpusculum sp.]|uniref:transglycosylase SLT domain-containing protein n=1 Tax=Methylicorpusculum sp. TaxID=2713644 RepID=UPI00272F5A6D|nr:transglycosylase SLT domain-containing protein [Methylicorpusculum sp.]MDP2178040.1 transglycosylase SLT domain-containing protein [Methylicorpusculum sp.]MDP3528954.1 transglycosylase SLT domain-containing protein [Methylicorpusculum sp.]MDZ4153053.1 transglycosylase SLT domain-containing protein [Methylicorpusculum sp.]